MNFLKQYNEFFEELLKGYFWFEQSRLMAAYSFSNIIG